MIAVYVVLGLILVFGVFVLGASYGKKLAADVQAETDKIRQRLGKM